MSEGKSFHVHAPATGRARSPTLETLTASTDRLSVVEDRSLKEPSNVTFSTKHEALIRSQCANETQTQWAASLTIVIYFYFWRCLRTPEHYWCIKRKIKGRNDGGSVGVKAVFVFRSH